MIMGKNVFYYEFEVGRLGIAESSGKITNVFFHNDPQPWPEEMTVAETSIIKEAARQLTEYFQGNRKVFDLPLEPDYGTPFMCSVWKALCDLPYGAIASYKDIATTVGNPKACRAVGSANNRNPIGIIVPCHRVIGANGKLVGYAGGLDIKSKLLELERRNK